jgi:hypothetical protein
MPTKQLVTNQTVTTSPNQCQRYTVKNPDTLPTARTKTGKRRVELRASQERLRARRKYAWANSDARACFLSTKGKTVNLAKPKIGPSLVSPALRLTLPSPFWRRIGAGKCLSLPGLPAKGIESGTRPALRSQRPLLSRKTGGCALAGVSHTAFAAPRGRRNKRVSSGPCISLIRFAAAKRRALSLTLPVAT